MSKPTDRNRDNDHQRIDHFAEAERWLKIAEDQLTAKAQRFSRTTDDDDHRDSVRGFRLGSTDDRQR